MTYAAKKEEHEGIEIDDLRLNITGMVDGEPESNDPASKMVYYFYVIDAQVEVELGGKTFFADCSQKFVEKLNDDYSQEIEKQIKGE